MDLITTPGTQRPDPTDAELVDWYFKRIFEIRFQATKPENLIDVVAGEDAHTKLGELVECRLQLSTWECRIVFTFALERVRDLRSSEGATRIYEHLSMGFTVPDHFTRAEVNANRDSFLAEFADMIGPWFPNRTDIHAQLTAQEPVATANPQTRQVTWRTPVCAHYLAPVEGANVTDLRAPMLGR